MATGITDAKLPLKHWQRFSMQLVSSGDWRHCEATRKAAAIAALGVPIAPQKCFRVREGDEVVTYLHEPRSAFPHFAQLDAIKPLLTKYIDGKLDPLHPLMDALCAIANAEALYFWQKIGRPCALGYEHGRQRTRLIENTPHPHPGPYAKVTSLAKAAALARLGFPVLAIEEVDAQTSRFVLPRLSVPMQVGGSPIIYDAADLLAQGREGKLLPTHPFALGCLAASTWLKLLAIVRGDEAVIMFRAAGTRSAFVHASATRAMLDDAEAHAAGRA